jgi:hypothetical protein
MENRRAQIPNWDGWRYDELQEKRKAREEKELADVWGKASDVVWEVVDKLEQNPEPQEVAVRLDGLSDKVVDAVVSNIENSNWVVARVKQSGLNNLLVFDVSERPVTPSPEPHESDDEEGDEGAQLAKAAKEADEEDTLCGK